MANSEKLKFALEYLKLTGEIPKDAFDTLTDGERELVLQIQKADLVEEALAFLDDLNADEDWKILRDRIAFRNRPTVPLWKSIAKYAAIFIGLLMALYFYRTAQKMNTDTPMAEESIKLKIGNEAIKVIHEGDTQKIVSGSGKIVGEQKGNRISHGSNTDVQTLVYNELEIPYGKIFDVELSDGTLVHLNSGTKIRYPIKFLKGQKREVFIDGEAYFKVSKDSAHPFIVHADAIAVEVLGTEFNISSYKEDRYIKTTLVEGSVSQSSSAGREDKVFLRPGQKAAWNKIDRGTDIDDVDVDLYIGWIKGEMVFRNAAFEDMARKLERRYNINIQNNNAILKDKRLNARFNVKVEDIVDILNSIQEIQVFEYRINGREIVID